MHLLHHGVQLRLLLCRQFILDGDGQPKMQTLDLAFGVKHLIQLLERLNGVLATRDTPRGLVVTVTDGGFSGAALRPAAASEVARLSVILASQPGLRIAVEGHTDGAATEDLSFRRAASVRSVLLASGFRGSEVSSHGLGNSRPIVSNATEAGRVENRRVEIGVTK